MPETECKTEEDIPNDQSLMLKSMDGFVLVVSAEGDFVYVSENVSEYLGISQVSIGLKLKCLNVYSLTQDIKYK